MAGAGAANPLWPLALSPPYCGCAKIARVPLYPGVTRSRLRHYIRGAQLGTRNGKVATTGSRVPRSLFNVKEKSCLTIRKSKTSGRACTA